MQTEVSVNECIVYSSEEKLLTEETYKELPEKLNLILVPMENADGAVEIHLRASERAPVLEIPCSKIQCPWKRVLHVFSISAGRRSR